MVTHIVFFKIKEDLNDQKDFYAQKIIDLLKDLPQKIPQILKYELGKNVADRSGAFDVALISAFKNWEDLNIYREHQEHKKAVEEIKNFIEKSAFVDYDTKSLDFDRIS